MLFHIFVILAVFSSVVSSANLRATSLASTDVDNAPFHETLGHRVAHHYFKDVRKGRVAPGLKQNISLHSIKKSMEEVSVLTSRTRPNADCSGPITDVTLLAMGVCFSNPLSPPYKLSCEPAAGGGVSAVRLEYDPEDTSCEGDVTSRSDELGPGNRCAVDEQLAPYHGYQMKSAQCGADGTSAIDNIRKPGLLYVYLSQGFGIAGFKLRPFDTCELFVDYQYGGSGIESGTPTPTAATRFYYIKMVSCDEPTGIVKVHAYSDPSCHRKLYSTAFDLTTSGMYNDIGFDASVGLYGGLVCPGGGFFD
jgi:hypothetical protein